MIIAITIAKGLYVATYTGPLSRKHHVITVFRKTVVDNAYSEQEGREG